LRLCSSSDGAEFADLMERLIRRRYGAGEPRVTGAVKRYAGSNRALTLTSREIDVRPAVIFVDAPAGASRSAVERMPPIRQRHLTLRRGGWHGRVPRPRFKFLSRSHFDGEGPFGRNKRGGITHFIYYEFGRRLGKAKRVSRPRSLPIR